ncbi:protein DCL, chloroplastic isoform X2 [Populus trichocarpa]|nr:protein DCL, chloroplastic isoform X2 [Populus trichocarpa]
MAQYKLSNHPFPDPKMAASALLSQLLRLRLHHHHRFATGLLVPLRRSWCSNAEYIRMEEDDISVLIDTVSSLCEAAKYSSWEEQNYRQWKDEEAEIWRDIEPIAHLAKEILHSNRYKDGEQLTDEDEKAVAGRLLVYHPNCDDKVGCGLDSIAVDRHSHFKTSRCLFVVRSDGGWIDFSYRKCLRAYIQFKYPTHAERFIKEHFKHGLMMVTTRAIT